MDMLKSRPTLQALVLCNIYVVCVFSFDLQRMQNQNFDFSLPSATYAPDVNTLLMLKAALGSPTNPVLSSWNISTPLCGWNGVGWSHESSFPFNCEEESWSQTFTYATASGPVVTSLVLESAGLTGNLIPAISKLNELKQLALGNNSLTGCIPEELGNSPSLAIVSLEHNQLTGTIPASIWNLCRDSKLTTLLLHYNNFSGPIPEPLGGPGTTCSRLTNLALGNNKLSGSIPPFLANFANLSWLDLSNNMFIYMIPEDFAKLTCLSTEPDRGFSVAGNHLMGPIPAFKESFSPSAFAGNSQWLCGLPLSKPCTSTATLTHFRHRIQLTPTGIILLISGVVVCVVLLVAVCIGLITTTSMSNFLQKKVHSPSRTSTQDVKANFPLGKLEQFYEGGDPVHLTEEVLLKCTSESLKETCYGTIYRACLPTKHMLYLRLLKDSITRKEPEFLQGVLRLAVIKHPNVVPLRAYYRSHKNEKLLIYDYVLGWTLADILHGKCSLSWQQRHKIALGAAQGLAHLHLELSGPLVHANLKASNIFVDRQHNSLLTNHGLHLLVSSAAANIIILDEANEGYKAPEFERMKKLTTNIDIFSFGIIFLEILTGQKPGNVPGTDKYVNLPEIVKSAILEDRLFDVLDPELLKPSILSPTENGLLEAIRLAMGCCAPSPSLRPTIREVVQKLEDIESKFLTKETTCEKSPCESKP